MPFGPGLQPGEPPLLNRPTVAVAGSRLRTRGGPGTGCDVRWSRRRDSNPEPAVYKTAALPIELRRRDGQGHTAEDPIPAPGNDMAARRMGQAWRTASGRRGRLPAAASPVVAEARRRGSWRGDGFARRVRVAVARPWPSGLAGRPFAVALAGASGSRRRPPSASAAWPASPCSAWPGPSAWLASLACLRLAASASVRSASPAGCRFDRCLTLVADARSRRRRRLSSRASHASTVSVDGATPVSASLARRRRRPRIALGDGLEQQDRPGDGRIERPDRAPHRDPHEEVASAADGRPEALALAADDDRERPAKVALPCGQRRVAVGARDAQAVRVQVGQGAGPGRRPGTSRRCSTAPGRGLDGRRASAAPGGGSGRAPRGRRLPRRCAGACPTLCGSSSESRTSTNGGSPRSAARAEHVVERRELARLDDQRDALVAVEAGERRQRAALDLDDRDPQARRVQDELLEGLRGAGARRAVGCAGRRATNASSTGRRPATSSSSRTQRGRGR